MRAKTLHPGPNATAKLIERRRSQRLLCEGEVALVGEEEPSTESRGVLCDISEEGFRASHLSVAFRTGQRVRFRHSFAKGVATLIWIRVVGQNVEGGFVISSSRENEQGR